MFRSLWRRLRGLPASPPVELDAPSTPDLARVQAAPPEAPAPTEQLLALHNRYGSVEHYYHFVLGFLAPLLLRDTAGQTGIVSLIRSCGPLDQHVQALRLPNVRIVPLKEWGRLRAEGSRSIERQLGFDSPEFYDQAAFVRLRRIVLARLGLDDIVPSETVLLVNRGQSPDYYQSEQAESKTSANLRRSVPNMAELEAAVAAAGIPTKLVELETAPFPDQVALFARSRTLVAQHGAALVNMLWMAPGGSVIEINPLKPGTKFVDYFRALAATCGHRYVCIRQERAHAPVDPAELVAALGTLVAET